MTTMQAHLSTTELEGRYETAADPVAKRHFHALWLLAKGHEIDEVAELLSLSTRWVYQLSGPPPFQWRAIRSFFLPAWNVASNVAGLM